MRSPKIAQASTQLKRVASVRFCDLRQFSQATTYTRPYMVATADDESSTPLVDPPSVDK